MSSIFEDISKLYKFYNFIDGTEIPEIPSNINDRINHLKEELEETITAVDNNDLEEVIDGLIDLIVIASGTLEMMGVNSQEHWNEVFRANFEKEIGIHHIRQIPNDLIKPDGWKGPNHQSIIEKEIIKKSNS